MLIDGDKSRKTFKRPLWRGGFYGRSCGSVVPPRSLRRNLREAILNMRTSRPNLSPEPLARTSVVPFPICKGINQTAVPPFPIREGIYRTTVAPFSIREAFNQTSAKPFLICEGINRILSMFL